MSTLTNDVKYGFRQLVKSPGFAAIAVASLALAIGANTAIFSLVNSMLLRSLPVPNAEELHCVNWTGEGMLNITASGRTEDAPTGGIRSDAFSYGMYRQFRDHAFTGAEAETDGVEFVALSLLPRLSVVVQGAARTADGLMVSDNFFDGLGLKPFLGQTFTAEGNHDSTDPLRRALLRRMAEATSKATPRCSAKRSCSTAIAMPSSACSAGSSWAC